MTTGAALAALLIAGTAAAGTGWYVTGDPANPAWTASGTAKVSVGDWSANCIVNITGHTTVAGRGAVDTFDLTAVGQQDESCSNAEVSVRDVSILANSATFGGIKHFKAWLATGKGVPCGSHTELPVTLKSGVLSADAKLPSVDGICRVQLTATTSTDLGPNTLQFSKAPK
jgi:hypothetical protein